MIVAGMPVSFALVDVASLVKQEQPCTPRLDKANGRTKLVESVGVEVTLGTYATWESKRREWVAENFFGHEESVSCAV